MSKEICKKIVEKYKHQCDIICIDVINGYTDEIVILPYIRIGNMVCDKPLYVYGKGSTEKLYRIVDEYITEMIEKLKNYKGE